MSPRLSKDARPYKEKLYLERAKQRQRKENYVLGTVLNQS